MGALANGQDDQHDPGVEDKSLGLLSAEAAQKLPAVVRRDVATAEEIADLLAEVSLRARCFGSISRDKHGVHQLNGPWTTLYLHTDGWFQSRFPVLYARFAEIVEQVDAEHWRLIDGAEGAEALKRPVARTIEVHSVRPGGALPQLQHIDSGSLWTFDLLLAQPDVDFSGGALCTPEVDGSVLAHSFGRGDALVFPSHKRHHVRPVTWGFRQVLVIEFWHGEERTCAHRCLQRWGACDYSSTQSRFDRILLAAPTHDDPVLG